MTKAIVLFSGGLDSLLAVRILQEQGVEVEALTVETPFHRCEDAARPAAERLGIPLHVRWVGEDYTELLRAPRWGFGKAMNPCLDCRNYMCQLGKQLMEELDADFVATGEVAGQRPNSQKEHQLNLLTRQSGLEGRLLRPLSAKILPMTDAERDGRIDRSRLYHFSGRGRSQLIQLAHDLGIEDDLILQPSTGCLLTERSFTSRIRDLLKYTPDASYWQFKLLPIGRHLRISPDAKAIIGRKEQDNTKLDQLARGHTGDESAFLYPDNFLGPAVVWLGPVNNETLATAGALMLRFCNKYDPENAIAELTIGDQTRKFQVRESDAVNDFRPL